jgi:alkylated DNA repair dioxygenase AlkB
MNTLFDIEPILPAGFHYYPGFLNEEEEEILLAEIKSFDLRQMKFHEFEAKRKVISFGKGWSFTEQALKEGDPIPPAFDFLTNKIAAKLNIETTSIAQFLITEYPVGSVINWHRDAPPFEMVAGVSLLSDCTFKLRPHAKEKQGRKSTISMMVEKRSLYCMQGEAKTQWQHSTAPVSSIRYSLTFRTVKG